jgi:hypothetical protein
LLALLGESIRFVVFTARRKFSHAERKANVERIRAARDAVTVNANVRASIAVNVVEHGVVTIARGPPGHFEMS